MSSLLLKDLRAVPTILVVAAELEKHPIWDIKYLRKEHTENKRLTINFL